MARQIIVLSEDAVKLLREVSIIESKGVGKGSLSNPAYAAMVDKYREIIMDTGLEKWQPSEIREIPEDVTQMLMRVIMYFSYGELKYSSKGLFVTIEH